MNKQFNVTFPLAWIHDLKKKCLEENLKDLNNDIKVQDLIREAVMEKYNFNKIEN